MYQCTVLFDSSIGMKLVYELFMRCSWFFVSYYLFADGTFDFLFVYARLFQYKNCRTSNAIHVLWIRILFSAAEFVSLALKGLFVSCSRLSVLVFVFNYYLYLHIAISYTRVEMTKNESSSNNTQFTIVYVTP